MGAEGVAADPFRPAALAALAAFPIEPDALELVSLSENITYRVVDRRDGVAYALRLHRPWYHTLDELISERAWVRALADAGIAVQAPLRTNDGQEYASVTIPSTGERRFAGLARWATGRVLAQVLRETTDTRIHDQAATGSRRPRSRGTRWMRTASWAARRTGGRSGITKCCRPQSAG